MVVEHIFFITAFCVGDCLFFFFNFIWSCSVNFYGAGRSCARWAKSKCAGGAGGQWPKPGPKRHTEFLLGQLERAFPETVTSKLDLEQVLPGRKCRKGISRKALEADEQRGQSSTARGGVRYPRNLRVSAALRLRAARPPGRRRRGGSHLRWDMLGALWPRRPHGILESHARLGRGAAEGGAGCRNWRGGHSKNLGFGLESNRSHSREALMISVF